MILINDILDFCKQEGRVCPMPKAWNQLYELIPEKVQKSSGGWTPPVPLILAAWHETTRQEKSARLAEHLVWADTHGALEKVAMFLQRLPEEQWFHEND